ncbi:MAG: hypothetical protein JRF63_09860 [Deltaproteobacteria bacterium]|nr:hypothetical protein [Deltaproteobacteria bacterium]
MSSNRDAREKLNDNGALDPGESAGDELAELLKSSVAPPPPGETEVLDPNDGRMSFTPAQQAEIRETLASYSPPPIRRRRTAPLLVAGALMTAVAVVAFGALAWLNEPPRESSEPNRTEAAAVALQEARDQELVALRAAHQEMIAVLEERIGRLDAGEEPRSGASVAQLSAKLEEVRAESYQLEVEAISSGDRQRSRPRSHPKRTAKELDAQVVEAEHGGSSADLDDNPYDGVTSATNLNNTVWAREETAKPASPAPADEPNSVDDLIESAIKGPGEKGSGGADQLVVNSLPGVGMDALPQRPPRRAVKQVMGSMLAAIRRCGGEPYERLVVELTVAGATGRVTRARTIDKAHSGTPVGTCAALAVKLAHFPKFQKNKVVIKYPFDL